MGTRESVVACYKMQNKLDPDTSVSENARKGFFRRVPDPLENGIPTHLLGIRHAPGPNFPGSVISGTEMQGSVIDLLWPIAGVHRI